MRRGRRERSFDDFRIGEGDVVAEVEVASEINIEPKGLPISDRKVEILRVIAGADAPAPKCLVVDRDAHVGVAERARADWDANSRLEATVFAREVIFNGGARVEHEPLGERPP